MRVVILAGGRGTRLAEETEIRPKPMIEIGGRPILWHIMKHYAHHGVRDFVVALGYKGDVIKRYFLDYRAMASSLTVCLASGEVAVNDGEREDWTVHLVDTGPRTETGGRIKRLRSWLDGTFMLTYGDGVSDIDIRQLLAFHRAHGRLATVSAVRPAARFGSLSLREDAVVKFAEKSQVEEGWINGGFFVLEPAVLDYIRGDETIFERDPLERLAADGQLRAYRHDGFWQCMDTLRDLQLLESLWSSGRPPWRLWA